MNSPQGIAAHPSFLGCSEINIADATGLADNKNGILAAAYEKIHTIC